MLNAVLFDLDNTLVDRNRAFRECVDASFREPAVRKELLELDAGGHGDREALLAMWERHAGAPMTQAGLGSQIADRLQPDRGLLNALHALAEIVPLGIVTNGGSETQRRKIRAAGLDEVIPRERVWISAEVGRSKPDPRIFLMASQSLGVAPENCLVIGDHEPHDIVGATAAGMCAQLVDAVLDGERLAALMKQERAR
jgi:HAD superfamily hydrolase (TIGR01509 family)